MEMLIYKLPLIVIVASPKSHSNRDVASGIPNTRLFWTPCLQVTWHGACAVNFWPLTWANASLRLYISLTVQVRRMVTMERQ